MKNHSSRARRVNQFQRRVLGLESRSKTIRNYRGEFGTDGIFHRYKKGNKRHSG